MDGNGRWATKRKLPKIMGHRKGVETVDLITEVCAKKGIKALTLYTFSTENWKRSEEEVNALMSLLKQTIKSKGEKLKESNVKFNVIGRIEELSDDLRKAIEEVIEDTSKNTGMILTLALNYGGRQEIVDAVKKICSDKDFNFAGFNVKEFEKYLYTYDLPSLDLVIRTSGEKRTSNFLLWQSAYAEFYFTDKFWPDFDEEEIEKAFNDYQIRQRRFGG